MTKFILSLFILVFGLVMSGIIVLLDVTTITNIPFTVWFFSFSTIAYLYFRYKFKKIKAFKYFLIRNYVKLNYFFKKIDSKVAYHEENKITPMQEKAIKLWKLCLRDKNTNISCSISNQTRQIEKNNLLIILSPLNQVDYYISILDTDNGKNCIYEIRIGQKLAETVISTFDYENERRMKEGEEERRNSIYSDLDKLLLQEEEALKPFNKPKERVDK